jgi:hypothetical protein
MLSAVDAARDILLMEAAAEATELDDESAAAAQAAARRIVIWAKAQLAAHAAIEEAASSAVAGEEEILLPADWPEPRPLPRANPEEAAFRRRSGGFHKNPCGSGFAQGSQDALKQMRSLTMVCCRPECDALVDFKVARRQALQAERARFEPGDGCAGLLCSAKHKPARFKKQQRKYAAGLESGRRLLVRWPRDRADLEVAAYPMEAARSAAASTRAALE